MKKMVVPKLNISTNAELAVVSNALQDIAPQQINVLNWIDEYPSLPEVSFRIAHNDEAILLQYAVHENELLAAVTEDNGAVWTDSCVEFFVSFDRGEHYYNAEFSCIGKALLGYRKVGERTIHASQQVMQLIERLPSLGTDPIVKTKGDFSWTLTLVIPISAFWKSHLKNLSGVEARGNFYKCGDNLSTPHFVSWSVIDTPKPSFHQPPFFGQIVFE